MRAAGYFAVTANVSAESAEAIGRHLLRRPELAGLQGPTVSKVVSKTLGQHGWYAVRVVVRQESLLSLVDYLRRAGGTDVTVSRLDYVFGDRSRVLPGPHRATETALAYPAAEAVDYNRLYLYPAPRSTMTATAAAPAPTMRPYHRQGTIDYARLDFDPNEPVLKPDAMQQNLQLLEIFGLLSAHYTDFNHRPDVFLDSNTILCYDPDDLNVRVSPDVYLAFGVDAQAIRQRKLYLPWEVGKPPDWVLEIGSSSTGPEDVGRKRDDLRPHRRAGILALRSAGWRVSRGSWPGTGWWPGRMSLSS